MNALARIAESARLLKEQLLQPRRVYLKGKAPKSRYVHQLQREISAERAKPIEMLLAISYANIDDGLSSAVVTQWAQSYVAQVEAYESERRQRRGTVEGDIPLLPRMVRETRAQAALDEAQQRVLTDPNDPDALDAVISASAAYDAEQEGMLRAVRSRRARITGSGAVLTVSC